MITKDLSWHGFGMEDMSSSYNFHESCVEIILTSLFTIILLGIGLVLSGAIRYSFTLLVGVH